MADLRVPSVNPSPADDGVLAGVTQPRSKSSFLTAMLRTLAAGSRALMYYGPGSLPHRMFEAVAIELSRASFDAQRLARRAVREAAYRAFAHPTLFPPRRGATYSSGAVTLSVPLNPFEEDLLVRAGEPLRARSGLTAHLAEDVVLRAGQTSVSVLAISDVSGVAGTIAPGQITGFVGTSRLRVSNPGPIAGGLDEETEEAYHGRFQGYILGIQTGNAASVLSAARAPQVEQLTVKQAALLRPWRLPHLNREMGYGYVVIDAGGGAAPTSLIVAAQQAVSEVSAALEEAVVISCNPYVISLEITVEPRLDAEAGPLTDALQLAYAGAFDDTRIEDGSGVGAVSLAQIRSRLDGVPGVVGVRLSGGDSLDVPVGARAVAGVATITLTRRL